MKRGATDNLLQNKLTQQCINNTRYYPNVANVLVETTACCKDTSHWYQCCGRVAQKKNMNFLHRDIVLSSPLRLPHWVEGGLGVPPWCGHNWALFTVDACGSCHLTNYFHHRQHHLRHMIRQILRSSLTTPVLILFEVRVIETCLYGVEVLNC